MYISKKIFFTLNGSLLGRPFDLLDSYPIFASSAISAYQDSITFNFTSPFKFNLELLISEENHLLQTQINEESLHISEVYKLVYEYLEYQGYADTLKSLQEHMGNDRPVLSLEKSRSYSSRFSERYDSIDIGPDCQTCQTYERICKVCLKKIMQNVEPSSNIRLPESRNRCDSVDLASLYLKPQNSFIENTQVQCTIDAVKKRGMLRDVILTGNMKEAVKFISLNFPELLTDETCMLFINVQEFIEIVKSGDFYAALEFAREKLAEARNFKVFCRNGMDVGIFVWEVVGLIAYTRPQESPLAPLLKLSQLELTADLVNSRILQKSGKAKCSLEEMLKEAIATQYLFQENILMAKSPSITLNI